MNLSQNPPLKIQRKNKKTLKMLKINKKTTFFAIRTMSAAVAITIFVLTLAHPIKQALAETLQSDNFTVQFGNFNVTSGKKESDSFKLTDTVGQVAAGPYGNYGSGSFFLGGGFQYIYQLSEFSFNISKIDIDLGEIIPGNFSTDSNQLTISTKGAGGYNIYAYELHKLQNTSDNNYQIPNTSCDSGNCTISSAKTWTNATNDGFGYNMSGNSIPADFVSADYFRPFADESASENMQVVMHSDNVATDERSTVTYKASINPTQGAGSYETSIVFVAVPGY